MFRPLVLALALLAAPACHSVDPYDPNDPPPQGAMLVVQNQHFNAVDVYAIGDGLPTRVGTVTGNSTARFALSESLVMASGLRLVATPIGGNGRASSGPVQVRGGETITFTVTSTLRGSNVSVH